MATAAPSPLASSKEKTNGAKLSRLLVDGGTKVLRNIFDSHHPPARLAADLSANYLILDNLFRRKRILNRHQWDKLFPPGGALPDSNSFDITLLFLLLTNICGLTCPLSGWHAKPSSSDTSLEANLARVKFFRNVLYGHVTTTGINTPSFLSQWGEISGVLVALGLDQAEIDRLKAERCGEEDYLKVLRDWADSEEDIKSHMKELRQSQTETQQTVEEMHQIQLDEHCTLHCNKTKLEELCQAQREDRQVFHELHKTQNMTYEAVEELLENRTKTGQALETVQADVQEIKQTMSSLEGKQKEDTADEALHEFAKSEFEGDIKHHAGRFQEGTREWIFTKVERWLDDRNSQNRVMVISGNAGMGKTVISAVICQRMQQAGRLSGSHFCQHNNIRYKNPQLMLQSLACHLCHALPDYKDVLVETLSRNVGRELNNMGVEELFALLFKEPLSSVCDPGHNMLMVIDGLDESEFKGRNELLDVIANHFCKLPVWIRFLVTTRPERNITEKLKLLKPFLLESADEMNLKDIKTFFERRLQPAVKPDNFESIVAMLVAKCEGLMLYAYFLVLYFEEEASSLHQASFDVSLPLGISSVYHRYFKRLENELITELGIKEEKFLDLLCCLCASREPLPIDLVSKVLLPSTDSPFARRKVPKALSSVSSLLPIRNDCLHVIHKSVKDWLTGTSCYGEHDFLMDEEVGHRLLGNLCAQELDDLKARGVHKVQVTSAQKYALYHGARHLLHVDENRRQPKLEELAKKYVLDLELLFARVCINNSKATEDLFWLHDGDILSLLSEDSRDILTTLKILLRKHHRRLNSHPQVFLQAVLNEGGTALSCVAENLLLSKYSEISCMEYVLKDTQEEFVLAKFCCSSQVACLDVSKGLDYMACECIDGTLQLWSLETAKLIWTRPVKVAKHVTQHFAFRVAHGTAAVYRSVVFYPPENLILPGILSHAYAIDGELKPLFPKSDCIFTVCSISGDMTKMLTDCPDNEKCLVLWSLTEGSEIARFSTDEAVVSFAWSSNGRLIAVSFCTGLISLIDATNDFRTLVQREVPRVFGGIKFSSDHKAVFAFTSDRMKNLSCRFNINMVGNHSFSLDLSADDGDCFESHCDCGFLSGDVIPASSRDLSFCFCLNKGTVLKFSPGKTTIKMLNANTAAVKFAAVGKTRDLVLSVNGDTLFVFSRDLFVDLIEVWDTSSGNLVIKKEIEQMFTVRAVAVRDGVLFACRRSSGNFVELWDSTFATCICQWTSLGEITRVIPMSETRVACVERGEGGVGNERGGKMTILDTSSRSVVASVTLDYRRNVVACNNKCQFVTASGHTLQCSDGTSVLWETDLGLPAHNSDDDCYCFFFGVFSPADKYLLIRVHCSKTGDCLYVLDACSGTVHSTLLKGRNDVADCKFISEVECVILCVKSMRNRALMEDFRLELHNVLSGDVLTVLDLDHALDSLEAAVCPRNRLIAVELFKPSRTSSKLKVIRAWSSERKVCGNNGSMGETEGSNDEGKQMISTRCILL